MNKVKILWSGITGRTGVQAERFIKDYDNVEIVAGICHNKIKKYYTFDELDSITEEFDVIIDFSHKDVFNKILDFAVRKNKVLISGTSGVSDEQLANLEKASYVIPIFRGGNFRFEIEKFIDDVVEYSKSHDNIKLVETHYKTKKIPSETAKVVAKRVLEETGKIVTIESHLLYDDLINDWRVDRLNARVGTDGFETLAKHLFKIAYMMKDKKADGLYDLRRLIKEAE